MAKHLAARASWESGKRVHPDPRRLRLRRGIRRGAQVRESRLYLVAPISTNLILSYLAEHVLGLPRSF